VHDRHACRGAFFVLKLCAYQNVLFLELPPDNSFSQLR